MIRMVKGSHIVVPRLNREQEAYILQNEDERIVFVIPYEDHFSLVGTTDVEYEGDPKEAKISPEETDYLLDIVNAHFVRQLTPSDVRSEEHTSNSSHVRISYAVFCLK